LLGCQLKKWTVTNYFIRELNDTVDKIRTGERLDSAFNLCTRRFTFSEHLKEVMTTPELKEYIGYMYKSGQPDIDFTRWNYTGAPPPLSAFT